MALNFPGPYGLKIFYTTTPVGFPAMTHKLEVNVKVVGTPTPGTSADDIVVETHDSAGISLEGAMLAIVNAMRPLYHTSTDFTLFELWRYAPNSFDATFITSDVIGLQGTSVTNAAPAGQVIMTFRTVEGGSLKLYLMEASFDPGRSQAFPTSFATINTLAGVVTHPSNGFIWARDTSRPVAPKAFFPGQNERLFKKRYRDLS